MTEAELRNGEWAGQGLLNKARDDELAAAHHCNPSSRKTWAYLVDISHPLSTIQKKLELKPTLGHSESAEQHDVFNKASLPARLISTVDETMWRLEATMGET